MSDMPREEAIEILEGAIKKPNTKDGYLGQALTMGIEALKNQKSLQTELEEIKAEIHDIRLEIDCDSHTGDKVIQLIDKRISELKGENNETDN